ncbi:uncharacterized protein FYW61_008726 isoform 2-T2 [Anableps anableps]
MEQNTFTKQRELFIKKSRGMQLQQRLQELKERERRAQQHNRQLLLQFERAQDTLREMMACNAAMKTIRMEYERYLEENLHRWQQQLQEKTQASHKKRMEDDLKSYLQHNKDQVSTATVDKPLISQGPSIRVPKVDAPQMYPTEENSPYSRDNSSYYPHPESSWLIQAGMPPGFFRAPFQPQSPSPFPPPNFPYSHPLLLQHLTSLFDQHQPWARPEAVGRAPPRCSNPCADGIPQGSSGQLHVEEPSALSASQIVEREDETSTASSKRVSSGGGRRCLTPELDVKPVRLSSGHAESSESGRDSSLTSREKKKEKKGRAKPSSSESERCGSQKSSRTSSEVVAASCTVALGSETNSSSEEGGTASRRRTERGRVLNTGSPPSKKELHRSEEDERTVNLSEKAKSPAQDNKSGSCREEESDGDVVKSEKRDEHTDDEEVYSSEQSNTEEKDEEEGKKNPGSGDEEKENEVKSEESGNVEDEEESDVEVPSSRNQKEDQGDEEEQSDKLENEDRDEKKQDSASLQDEDEENEGSEKIEEDQGGSSEEEDQLRSDEAGDSEDSIISPQENSPFVLGPNR